MTPSDAALKKWIPGRVFWHDAEPVVDWLYIGNDRLIDPFFYDTTRNLVRTPFNAAFRRQTPLADLPRSTDDSLYPTGFIFHMSRCGSTLVSQMLAALDSSIVISEAPPIDTIVRSRESDDQRIEWLTRIIAALGRKRGGGEKHFFIKFDSWHMLEFDLIRKTFPDVPWIFLYRNPIEVMVSQMRQRGLHMVPGGAVGSLLGLRRDEELHMRPETFCARMLATICRAATAHAEVDDGALLVNYSELPSAITTTILDHFRVTLSDDDIDRMRSVASLDAKSPRMSFESDTESKLREATPEMIEAVRGSLEPIYGELETMRMKTKR